MLNFSTRLISLRNWHRLFGFDTASISPITQMPSFVAHFGQLDPLTQGVLVSIILVPSALTGLLAGNLSDLISRKYTISLGCTIFALGSALSVASVSLDMLIAARCIAGVGEGLFLSAVGVYLCEISPKHLRGRLMIMNQIFNTGAIAAGFFICYGTVNIRSSFSWRLPFMLQAIISTFVALTCPLLPYSPRWLLTRGRREEAERVLDYLVDPKNVEERRELLQSSGGGEKSSIRGSQKDAFRAIWREDVRKRTFLGIALNCFQQLSGIDFVLFFAPLLFQQAGLDANTSSFLASGVTGILLICCSIAGQFYINRVGRRTIWLVGGTATATCHLLLGSLYASGAARTPVGKWIVIILIELFAISFSSGWSLITKLYTAEIQPSRTRSAASSVGQGCNQAVNFAVAVSGPYFLNASAYGPYFLYGGFSALGVVVGYLFMQETMNHSLETIDATFSHATLAVPWLDASNSSTRNNVFRNASSRLNHAQIRRRSRSNSSQLPGERRGEIRKELGLASPGRRCEALRDLDVIEEKDSIESNA
ncbi:uncharacterized protein JCM15063_005174 [Sporobolomyces koalae]|uniref:uncharacterized protein n=1 Tax=Sporobolomyces koalae TaxID=500713 RepID=UPI00317F9766